MIGGRRACTVLTWVYDRFAVVPYLRAIGDLGQGKSRLLQVIGSISYRPTLAGGATTVSPIFRVIDRYHGTLVLDEADFGASDIWADIVKILNCGYERGFNVLRAGTSESAFDPESYACFGPKLLGTRRRFKDEALESRCFSVIMARRRPLRPDIPLVLGEEFHQEALSLRNKLLLWRLRRYQHTVLDARERFDALDARLNQILLPLLSVVEGDAIRQGLVGLAQSIHAAQRERRVENSDGLVAAALVDRWQKRPGRERLELKEVTDRVNLELGSAAALKPWEVSTIVRDVLGLTTRRVGGRAYVYGTDAQIEDLARRFDLGQPDSGTP